MLALDWLPRVGPSGPLTLLLLDMGPALSVPLSFLCLRIPVLRFEVVSFTLHSP